MSRSGYADDCDDIVLYRRAVGNALAGKRGRAFLQEMAEVLDAMPVKELSRGELRSGKYLDQVCALGAVVNARCVHPDGDPNDRHDIGRTLGIAPCMAAEIMHENDDDMHMGDPNETPSQRWQRMRRWVDHMLEDPRSGEV